MRFNIIFITHTLVRYVNACRSSVFPEVSGKFLLAARMLNVLRSTTKDRIVIVSCYTQTLDLFGKLCTDNRWPYIRLDGSTSAGKRQKLVDQFNDQARCVSRIDGDVGDVSDVVALMMVV